MDILQNESLTGARGRPVILFDGVCNLCNSAVNFIINRDKKNRFRFAALQSDAGQKYIKKFNLDPGIFSTFVLIIGDKYFTRSTATLRVFKELGSLWSIAYALIIIPLFIRNVIYDVIAKNRYRWFGKRETCMVPTPGLKEKFLP